MADFRQLALEFVLADDEKKLAGLAQQAARALRDEPANSNPVARWVESVQPWMPGAGGDEGALNNDETPDWAARAKALEFLSRTLDSLDLDVLKPSQVKLLIAFFGAMFDIDHKAGIKASATALSRIATMRSFQPQSAGEVIRKVCAMGDDFTRQLPKTRLAIYDLLELLIAKPEVIRSLAQQEGVDCGFMKDLIQLCRNERDPDCLMVWFSVLTVFLARYDASQGILEEVYEAFRAYFPITLPRTSQSKVAPEDLKSRLRGCFSATHRLAGSTLPFLLGKLDQGDGVTVNVKLDILKTIKACLESYKQPEDSVIPFVNRIWGSLKYEVRNGEVEDTIWATLEVLKTLTLRLKGDNLRDYTLTVTRDCVHDLCTTMYVAPAGRLLVSVLSASPAAFALMAAPMITHIKENLRHPKARTHEEDLLKLLHVTLETRALLVESGIPPDEASDFAAIDHMFKSLYDQVFKELLKLGLKDGLSTDEIKVVTATAQGAGALVAQIPSPSSRREDAPQTGGAGLLLSDDVCSEICVTLFSIIVSFYGEAAAGKTGSDNLLTETILALRRAISVYTPGFQSVVSQAFAVMSADGKKDNRSTLPLIQNICAALAFVGCSPTGSQSNHQFQNFLHLVCALTEELNAKMEAGGAWTRLLSAYVAGLQAAVRHMGDGLREHDSSDNSTFSWVTWVKDIATRYPQLRGIVPNDPVVAGLGDAAANTTTSGNLREDFLMASLYIVRHVYRISTKPTPSDAPTTTLALDLSDKITATDGIEFIPEYLHMASSLASCVLREISAAQQSALGAHEFMLNLFRDELIAVPELSLASQPADTVTWAWIAESRVNSLALGVLEGLHPRPVAELFKLGAAQSLLLSRGPEIARGADAVAVGAPVRRAIMSTLANKYPIETLDGVVPTLVSRFQEASKRAAAATSDTADAGLADEASTLFAIAAGLLRRSSGGAAQDITNILCEAPGHPRLGHYLARRLETVVAPSSILTKEYFAIVKPLWMQKVYMQITRPLMETAAGPAAKDLDANVRADYGVGALLMLKHMPVSIFEADADMVLRIAISTAQTSGPGVDGYAALGVLKSVLDENPEKAQDHLRSLVKICVACFSGETKSATTSGQQAERVGCGKIALEIVGQLPSMLEARHLVSYVPQMETQLTLACGHRSRGLRTTARKARIAWSALR